MSELLAELPVIANVSTQTTTGCGTTHCEIESNCDSFDELFGQNIRTSETLFCEDKNNPNGEQDLQISSDINQEKTTIRTRSNKINVGKDMLVNHSRKVASNCDGVDDNCPGNNKRTSSDGNQDIKDEVICTEKIGSISSKTTTHISAALGETESKSDNAADNNENVDLETVLRENCESCCFDRNNCQWFCQDESGNSLEMFNGHHGVSSDLFHIDWIYSQYEYPNVSRAVIQSEYVKNAIEESCNEQEKSKSNNTEAKSSSEEIKSEYRKLAFTHYRRLRSTISSSLLKIASWILYRLLSRIFTSITFNRNQIDSIRTCEQQSQNNKHDRGKKATPIVYLPLHRSHLDAILVSWILYMNNVRPPLVAAGDNMMIPFFGNLMRGLGAFFIKRPEGTKTSDGKNHLDKIYQAVLRAYIVENLKAGMSIGIFLEGGRSRTGKILLPKFGLLSIISDALEQGVLDDVYIVPVSISYEKVVDGTFVDESLGKPKAFESFVRASKAIWKTMHSRFGNVRVDFNSPFRLSEFLAQHHKKHLSISECNNNNYNNNLLIPRPLQVNSCNDSAPIQLLNCVACSCSVSNSTLNNSQSQTVYSKKKTIYSTNEREPNGDVKKNNENILIESKESFKREGVESLGRHVLLNAANRSAIMPTHLISFLLLNKYRNGVSLEQLSNDAQCITTFLQREKSINIAYGCNVRPASATPARTASSSSLSLSSNNLSSRSPAVENALTHLGSDLIVVEKGFAKWALKKNILNKTTPTSITQNGFSHFKQAYQSRSQNRVLPNELSDSVATNVTNSGGSTSNAEDSRSVEMTYIKPILTIRSALELHYYANNCTYSMLFESILANALFAFTTVDLSSLICDSTSYISNLTIDKREFFQKSKRLCHVFQYEFIFDKSCQSIDAELEQTFQRFVSKNIFVPINSKSTPVNTPNNGRFAYRSNSIDDSTRRHRRESLEVIDEEELDEQTNESCISHCGSDDMANQSNNTTTSGDFRLLLSSRNTQLLNFYASILSPFLESYWKTAEQLALLADANPNKEYEEKHVHHQLCLNLQQLYQKSQLKHAEAVSMTTIRNAVNYFAIESLQKIRCTESRRSIIRFQPDFTISDSSERPIKLAAKELRSYCIRFNK